jgi:hypothetical protein
VESAQLALDRTDGEAALGLLVGEIRDHNHHLRVEHTSLGGARRTGYGVLKSKSRLSGFRAWREENTYVNRTPGVLLQAEGTPEVSRGPIESHWKNDARMDSIIIVVVVVVVVAGCLSFPYTVTRFELVAASESAAAANN